jgi:hypothetical protein
MGRQIVVELIRLIGFVSFNELMMRKVRTGFDDFGRTN